MMRIFFFGVLGALLMSVFMAILRQVGISPMSLEMILGTLLLGEVSRKAFFFGFLWHLLNGGVFALIYLAGFNRLNRWGSKVGLAFGILHWFIAGIVLSLLIAFRGALPDRVAPASAFGMGTSFSFFLLFHLLYGYGIGAVSSKNRPQKSVESQPSERISA
jgi:hypothetical protein